MEAYERIKYYREKILGISQAKFAKKLKISASNYSNIEIARVTLTNRVLIDICEAYNLNEDWVKYGKEPIEKPKSREAEMLDFLKKINLEEDQSYYLDEDGNYIVPKYKKDDIVRRI